MGDLINGSVLVEHQLKAMHEHMINFNPLKGPLLEICYFLWIKIVAQNKRQDHLGNNKNNTDFGYLPFA